MSSSLCIFCALRVFKATFFISRVTAVGYPGVGCSALHIFLAHLSSQGRFVNVLSSAVGYSTAILSLASCTSVDCKSVGEKREKNASTTSCDERWERGTRLSAKAKAGMPRRQPWNTMSRRYSTNCRSRSNLCTYRLLQTTRPR